MSNQIEAGAGHSFELPRDKAGRIQWRAIKDDPALPGFLEEQARVLMSDGVPFTFKGLMDAGQASFANAVHRYYPGGHNGLRENLTLEPGKKPSNPKERGFWTQERILETARDFLANHGNFSASLLRKENQTALQNAVTRRYPGAFIQIRVDLGLEEVRKPNGFWTTETILEEAKKFFDEHGKITQRALIEAGGHDLSSAISTKFPGRARALRERLGLGQLQKENNFYTPETIEQEASEIIGTHGEISVNLLSNLSKSSLAHAIAIKYPGGMRSLKEKLGVPLSQRPNEYWKNVAHIEEEAKRLMENGTDLTQKDLALARMTSLTAAIYLYYPGRIHALREKLDVVNESKPTGYWNPDTIEKEASEFYQQEGKLSQLFLARRGKSGLVSAITKYYPGGLLALKIKLGIQELNQEIKEHVAPLQANEELEKLLEDKSE